MALTKCKECDHDVSTTASACPHCGAPDFLSDEEKELLRQERQKEQLRKLVERGGTGGVSLKNKEKKPKVRTERIQSPEAVATYNTPKMVARDVLRTGEELIFEAHPQKVYTLLLPYTLGSLFLILAIAVLAISIKGGLSARQTVIAVCLLVTIGLVIFIKSYLKYRFTIYCLTTNRVMTLSGVLRKDSYETTLEQVQDLGLSMSIGQRIFGCGNVIITTAGTAGVECRLRDVRDPRRVLSTLRAVLGE